MTKMSHIVAASFRIMGIVYKVYKTMTSEEKSKINDQVL